VEAGRETVAAGFSAGFQTLTGQAHFPKIEVFVLERSPQFFGSAAWRTGCGRNRKSFSVMAIKDEHPLFLKTLSGSPTSRTESDGNPMTLERVQRGYPPWQLQTVGIFVPA
jgi:hypothetical protein